MAHHEAADETDPHDAHDESQDIVLLELRSGAVRHRQTKPDHEGQSEDKQEALHPSLRPLQPVVLRNGIGQRRMEARG